VDGWRQICGNPDSNMVFTFHLHVVAVLSMQGLSDGQTKPCLLPLQSPAFTPLHLYTLPSGQFIFAPAAVIEKLFAAHLTIYISCVHTLLNVRSVSSQTFISNELPISVLLLINY